jgi:hypothetical protein
MSIIARWPSHRKGFDKSLFISRQAKCKYILTARQLREFALPAQLTGLLSRLLAGNCPGSKLVWRNICKVGCGWLSDRVTMMIGFRCLIL